MRERVPAPGVSGSGLGPRIASISKLAAECGPALLILTLRRVRRCKWCLRPMFSEILVASEPMLHRRALVTRALVVAASGGLGACRSTSKRDQSRVPGGPEDSDWASVRARFARLEDVTYLNNASLGMPPAAVAMQVALARSAPEAMHSFYQRAIDQAALARHAVGFCTTLQ